MFLAWSGPHNDFKSVITVPFHVTFVEKGRFGPLQQGGGVTQTRSCFVRDGEMYEQKRKPWVKCCRATASAFSHC